MLTRVRPFLPGALAGAVASLLTVTLATALRLVFGLPLPIETFSDRFLPFLPVSVFLQLLHLTGGALVSKHVAFFSSFLVLVTIGAVLGALYAALARSRFASRRRPIVLAAVLAGWLVELLVLLPAFDSNYRGLRAGPATREVAFALLVFFVLFAGTLIALYELIRDRPAVASRTPSEGPRLERRRFLVGAGGGVLALASGSLIASLYRGSAFGYDGTTNLGRRLPHITPNDRFYVVTKNFIDPQVDTSLWRFEVCGDVERRRIYDFGEIAGMESVEREVTLECISNAIGGGLLSNAVWTGVPLRRLIEAAGPKDGAQWVSFSAPDGFAHSVRLEQALEDASLLAYRMNGAELPHRHGYPARVLVQGAYGEVNVKWVERMTISDKRSKGYYERQGWKAERVHTTSRIDDPVKGQSLRAGPGLTVRGIAFAGDRGISRVEVSADGGRTWSRAKIDYARARTAWVFWSYRWRPGRTGAHELVVRAVDGSGAAQEARSESIDPDGASGYHRVPVSVV